MVSLLISTIALLGLASCAHADILKVMNVPESEDNTNELYQAIFGNGETKIFEDHVTFTTNWNKVQTFFPPGPWEQVRNVTRLEDIVRMLNESVKYSYKLVLTESKEPMYLERTGIIVANPQDELRACVHFKLTKIPSAEADSTTIS